MEQIVSIISNWLSVKVFLLIVFILFNDVNEIKGHPKITPAPKEINEGKPSLNTTCELDVYNLLLENYRNELEKSESDSSRRSLNSILSEGTFQHPENDKTERFSNYLDQLCLSIDKNKVIDVYAYECRSDLPLGALSRDTKCHCGRQMNGIDPNVPQPESKSGELKEYFMTVGLDRRLQLEMDECVSGPGGHCNTSLAIPLKCAQGFECRKLHRNGRWFQNKNTSAFYGICIDSNRKGPRDGDSSRSSPRPEATFPSIYSLIQFIVCSTFISFNG